jgi:hypothetical protein
MNLFEQFLQWVTYAQCVGDRWNILGVLWLAALVTMSMRRFAIHYDKSGIFPKPSTKSKQDLWYFSLMIFGFLSTMLLQMMVDDFITTPINLAFGSWALLAPHLGEFSFLKLLAFKWDVYALIIVYSMVFYLTKLWRFYQFTRGSAFWLILTVSFQIFLGSQHVFYFLNLSGWERIYTFWISYPWFRIFTGFLGASIIKKPRGYSSPYIPLTEASV